MARGAPADLVDVDGAVLLVVFKGQEAMLYVSVRMRGAKGSLEREPHLLLGSWVVGSGVLERERDWRCCAGGESDGGAAGWARASVGMSKMWRVFVSDVRARRSLVGEMARERIVAGVTPRRSSARREVLYVLWMRIMVPLYCESASG